MGGAFTDAYSIASLEGQQVSRAEGYAAEGGALAARSGCGAVPFQSDPEAFWPVMLAIDFGPSCTREDGRALGGYLTVTLDGPFHNPGTTMALEFDEFTADGHGLTGTYLVRNLGRGADSVLAFRHDITGATFTRPNETEIGT